MHLAAIFHTARKLHEFVCPDCVIANLDLLPLRLNESKNSKIGDRQRSLAVKPHEAGLLSTEGLKDVEQARH